jgi:hypothetical protein
MAAKEIIIKSDDEKRSNAQFFVVPIGDKKYYVEEKEAMQIIDVLSTQIMIKKCQT